MKTMENENKSRNNYKHAHMERHKEKDLQKTIVISGINNLLHFVII